MGWEEGLFTSLHSFHILPQLTEVAQTLCSFHRAPFTPRMLSVAAQEEKQHAARTRSPHQPGSPHFLSLHIYLAASSGICRCCNTPKPSSAASHCWSCWHPEGAGEVQRAGKMVHGLQSPSSGKTKGYSRNGQGTGLLPQLKRVQLKGMP